MEKPFFVSHTAGLVFDEPKDWYQYVQQHGYTAKEVVLESNGFKWNIHNCCLNPKRTEIIKNMTVSPYEEFIISTAQRADNLWVYGCHYNGILSDIWAGGGCGTVYDSDTFNTEDDAIKGALKEMLKNKDLTPKFRSIIQTEYNKRRIVQLTLF